MNSSRKLKLNLKNAHLVLPSAQSLVPRHLTQNIDVHRHWVLQVPECKVVTLYPGISIVR